MVGQRMLGVGGRGDGVARPLEGDEEGVALRVHDVTAMEADRGADELLVEARAARRTARRRSR